ncbi:MULTISPECIES: BtpA/SgcQ family protein [Eubacteriales]|nr:MULTISPECIES: BtpA/SgcQ family protein [Eubacteriales]ERI96638.1 BtpA family protein [Clostridium sp. ATCC 29733]SHG06385.1 hypothetical protein SAMN05444424_1335 [Bittarella massiliensis (ex Durand et al. 2017)]
MQKNSRFLSLFSASKPILGMLHLKGDTPEETVERAMRELDTLLENGVDGVIVEDYYGTADEVEQVLARIAAERPQAVRGVNVLHDLDRAFALAGAYGAQFIQWDSVAGHLKPEDEPAFAEHLAALRADSSACLLGGVRFKYQPYLSGRPLEEDMELALDRCDGIVVTGAGTGLDTGLEKIQAFGRLIAGRVPLIVGAGLTAVTAAEQLALADGAIVGSYFKEDHNAENELCPAHVADFMAAVRQARNIQ